MNCFGRHVSPETIIVIYISAGKLLTGAAVAFPIMIISFDLDDTLIPGIRQFPTEPKTWWHRLFSKEKIRSGTIQLIKTLRQHHYKIYVYTTSYRSPAYVRRLFFSYGISIDRVINKQVHDRVLGARGSQISKYPPAFDISIHVDDAAGVGIEGERHQFNTIIIAENDPDWEATILNRLGLRQH